MLEKVEFNPSFQITEILDVISLISAVNVYVYFN